MFTPVSARAAASYRQASATGASPHQIVSLLFEALLQTLHAAIDSVDCRDVQGKGRHIGHAVRLLDEGLKAGLNDAEGGDLAANLRALYEYAIRRLTVANLHGDRAILSEVIDLVAPVAQAWRQMGNTPNTAIAAGAAIGTAPSASAGVAAAALHPVAAPAAAGAPSGRGLRAMSLYTA